MGSKIPVSVVIVARNEAVRLPACLAALDDFDEVVVVDSESMDNTKDLAAAAGARVENFVWNGDYPKKRQWCLDNLRFSHDWIFFVDADEVVTKELVEEIRRSIKRDCDGFFVCGRYVVGGGPLRFGMKNKKLCLFRRGKFYFPVVDDLDLPGMGEIEGHYQPVPAAPGVKIGYLRASLLHEAEAGWRARHERYAAWEAGMNEKQAWPQDPVMWRQVLKKLFRGLPGFARAGAAFLHSYILKLGILDGGCGLRHAARRGAYYLMIAKASKARAQGGAASAPVSALRK